MRFIIVLLVLLMPSLNQQVIAEPAQRVKVAEPFISIYSGPGTGYPVFLDLPRGHQLKVLKRQNDWFKVNTDTGKEGWVHKDALQKTLTPTGERFRFQTYSQDDFIERDWELGTAWGAADGADVFNVYAGYVLNPVFSAELSFTQMIGSLSVSTLTDVKLLAHPFPEWRISPFFSLGTGTIKTKTRSSLVQQIDQEDNTSHVGFGLKAYLTRSFFLRAEYKEYVIFSSSNDNEEISIWSVGVGSIF